MSVFGFIAAKEAEHSISTLCRVLEVSRSGFHAWQARKPSVRALEDERLTGRIREIHESFFATLKKELVDRRAWPEKAELRTEIFDFIEIFYTRRRQHSTLGMLSPVDYETALSARTVPGSPLRGSHPMRR